MFKKVKLKASSLLKLMKTLLKLISLIKNMIIKISTTKDINNNQSMSISKNPNL
jgi:hypothetical protein